MERASISRIEEWDSRPVAGGYTGLAELADEAFTGAVTAGGTRLVMLNGRVVGVFDGDIEDFEGADATAYEAPDPALPLLFAMREHEGEVRGKYYTDDTPIREVDETLSSGGFTGVLELSENVLSGDYYLVYYGGRSLAVAFVGNERRVVAGDEAMQLAADEVGIYEVRAVDLEVTDVPEPADDGSPGPTAAAVDGDDASGEPDVAADAVEEADAEDVEEDLGADIDDATEEDTGAEAHEVQEPVGAVDAADDDDDEADEPADADEPPPVAEAEAPRESNPTSERPTQPEPGRSPGDGGSAQHSTAAGAPADRREAGSGDPDERFEEEARWREARTVPALDPDESERPAEDRPERPARQAEGAAGGEEPPPADAEVEALRQRLGRLEAELESSERERRRLTERLETALDERADVEDDREALESRIEELEARLQAAESAAASGASAEGEQTPPQGRSVDPETALDQTDLFVRYGSKGKATLKTAHEGQADREAVEANLRIETHSRFDTDTATVQGRPFDAYLEGTIQYRFVSWLVEELLYEIQETQSESALRALYDVLPSVDRAEFNGSVDAADEEDEGRTATFDVVCRDRMGKPLVVANINDSLDPATGEMMVRLVEDGTVAAEAQESIGAAFFVTASFFQPDALETVADATRGGGLLSRDSKKSFVKLARNGGYHLCLVEARGDDFHVAVPEF